MEPELPEKMATKEEEAYYLEADILELHIIAEPDPDWRAALELCLQRLHARHPRYRVRRDRHTKEMIGSAETREFTGNAAAMNSIVEHKAGRTQWGNLKEIPE